MKCEINCKPCADRWRQLIGKFKGADVRVVEGELKFGCNCDGCYQVLQGGSRAYATTVSTMDRPYRSWEAEYLRFQRKAEP